MNVYQKLMTVRKAFHGMKIQKTGVNKFAGYTYFELADFIPEAQQLFFDAGLCGVVSYGKEEATLTITSMDDASHIVITSPMAEANLKGCHPIQNLGAVETYTRRYLWVTALELVEHDVIDASEPVKELNKNGTKQGVVHKPVDGALESLDTDILAMVKEGAVIVTDMVIAGQIDAAVMYYKEATDGDADVKTAFWSLLDSKTRSTIKKHSQPKEI